MPTEKVVKLVTRTDLISTESVLKCLKEYVERIEKGELKPEQLVLIMMQPCVGESGCADYFYGDSGLTIEQKFWLVSKCADYLLQLGRDND
jgi:hypothetical protein